MDRGDAVARFAYKDPSLDAYWRAIILFGQNVASYKFALAGALLEIGTGSEEVSLDELALPFASRVAEHLRTHDKQGTFQQSRFLDACRAFNSGELDAAHTAPAVACRSLRSNDESTSPTTDSNCSSTRARPAAATSRFSQRPLRKPLRHTDLTKYYQCRSQYKQPLTR